MKVKTVVRQAARAISNTFASESDVESTDILVTLKKEHDAVNDLLEALSDAETPAQRRILVHVFRGKTASEGLVLHWVGLTFVKLVV